MRVTSISFQQTFPTGNFSNNKLGIEIEIDPDDSIKQVFEYAKKEVQQCFEALNPQINWNDKDTWVAPRQEAHIMPSSIRDTVDNIIEDIGTCRELKTLESYKLIAKTNERIMNAYNEKLKSFQ